MRSAHRESHPPQWTVAGLAHGTLPEHAEGGGKRLVVECHPDGSVFYDLYALPAEPSPFEVGLPLRAGPAAIMARAIEG